MLKYVYIYDLCWRILYIDLGDFFGSVLRRILLVSVHISIKVTCHAYSYHANCVVSTHLYIDTRQQYILLSLYTPIMNVFERTGRVLE